MENSLLDSVEAMEMVTTQKIEETVKCILREADMDQMTEFKLRISASHKLGFDLSGTNHKKIVSDVLDAFLLSKPIEEIAQGEATVRETVTPVNNETVAAAASVDGEDKRFICKLSEKLNATVEKFRGQGFLSIGKWNSQDNEKPFRGAHFSTNQWSVIKKNFTAIDEAITQCQSKSKVESKQNGYTSEAVYKNNTLSFSPIETSRFDGSSYLCWARQMQLFLKQLNLTYVLSEPCPSSGPSASSQGTETQADVSGNNWLRDDYLCHNHLLKSLSDNLYHQYLKKFKHAKELWDELKWAYQCDESNSKRSQVRKYIEFKMVEEKPLLEQVQDFNRIADSIVSTGMFLDETFHVSTIISKFPSSWKGFSTRLMEEEFLPVWMLMERVKAEEEFRKNERQGVTYRPAAGSSRMERRPSVGTTTHRGSQSIGWKRKEPEGDGRVMIIACENCGRKGHHAKNCWGKRLDERASGKPNRVDSSVTEHVVVSETQATNNNDRDEL